MVKADLIITWPRSCDYPLWRWWIRENRAKFNEIYVVFMETNQGNDYRDFIKTELSIDHITFLESPTVLPGQDWRNIAVNFALSQSTNDWVYFTEQDFFPMNNFWDEVYKLQEEGYQVLGVFDEKRLHPCCIIMRRDILNQTRKDFGIDPGRVDHFGLIQEDLYNLAHQVAPISKDNYLHMAGLSHNMTLVERGEAPNHMVPQFNSYLESCFKAPVNLDMRWIERYSLYMSKIDGGQEVKNDL